MTIIKSAPPPQGGDGFPLSKNNEVTAVSAAAQIAASFIAALVRTPEFQTALSALREPAAAGPGPDDLVTLTVAARALGTSKTTLNLLRKEGLPVACFVGADPRFRLRDVEAFLKERGRKTAQEKHGREGDQLARRIGLRVAGGGRR